MAKETTALVGSAPTRAGLEKLAQQYFYGKVVLQDGGKILNSSGTGHLAHFTWELKHKRYRLLRTNQTT